MIERTKLDPSEIGDIVVGTVLAPGSVRAIECRMAAIYAGIPGKFMICLVYSSRLTFVPIMHIYGSNNITWPYMIRF